jgi:hypothetical protein
MLAAAYVCCGIRYVLCVIILLSLFAALPIGIWRLTIAEDGKDVAGIILTCFGAVAWTIPCCMIMEESEHIVEKHQRILRAQIKPTLNTSPMIEEKPVETV